MLATLIGDIVLTCALSVVIILLCHWFRIPPIIGFLITGIVAGPYGLGLIEAVHEVEVLAEIGIVLLLFTIGIEFSLKSVLQIGRTVLLGGTLQVLLTVGIVFAVAYYVTHSVGQAIFAGLLVALSSTAIVLKTLQERGEIESPHGRSALAILIFQDIIIVPFMLLTPVLAGVDGGDASAMWLIPKGIAIIVFTVVAAKWIVPALLYRIAATRIRELFLISILAICFVVAWLTSAWGLSLALGAFLAGLIISESEYSHEAFANVVPFRAIFTSFFFISVGMLLNVSFLAEHVFLIVLLSAGVLVVKALLATLAAGMLGYPMRTSVLTGLSLSQIGEFSFLLAGVGIVYGLLPPDAYQTFLAVVIITMAATPFVIAVSPKAADIALALPLPHKLKYGFAPGVAAPADSGAEALTDHLIIVGYGIGGVNVARAAKASGVPYFIVEMNAATVWTEKKRGERIFYGDATHESVLQHAGIGDARVLVIVISDPAATRRITATARRLNQKLSIIVRTRFLQEMNPLYALGASEVVPEDFETSIELFSRVLTKYLVPLNEIKRLIREARADGYKLLREVPTEVTDLDRLRCDIPGLEVSTIAVSEDSPAVGLSLEGIHLRNEYGVTLVAIRREEDVLLNPGAETVLLSGDVVMLLGYPEGIERAFKLFQPSSNQHNQSQASP